jgi:hypothetical protein
MARKVILIGDSYVFGHGCSDKIYYIDKDTGQQFGNVDENFAKIPSEKCWGSLLQQKFPNIQVINIAKPGFSQSAMFRNLVMLQDTTPLDSNDIILMCCTFKDRIEIAHDTNPENPTSWSVQWNGGWYPKTEPKYYTEAKTGYVKYLYNDTIGEMLSNSAFMAIYGVAQLYKTQFAWSRLPSDQFGKKPDERLENMLQKLNVPFFPHMYRYDFSGIQSEGFNEKCYAPDQHCNDLGHSIYFEKVILPLVAKFGIQ